MKELEKEIYRLLPELKELSFGCLVKMKESKKTIHKFIGYSEKQYKILSKLGYIITLDLNDFEFVDIAGDGNYEHSNIYWDDSLILSEKKRSY